MQFVIPFEAKQDVAAFLADDLGTVLAAGQDVLAVGADDVIAARVEDRALDVVDQQLAEAGDEPAVAECGDHRIGLVAKAAGDELIPHLVAVGVEALAALEVRLVVVPDDDKAAVGERGDFRLVLGAGGRGVDGEYRLRVAGIVDDAGLDAGDVAGAVAVLLAPHADETAAGKRRHVRLYLVVESRAQEEAVDHDPAGLGHDREPDVVVGIIAVELVLVHDDVIAVGERRRLRVDRIVALIHNRELAADRAVRAHRTADDVGVADAIAGLVGQGNESGLTG